MIYRLVLAWALARGAFYWRRRADIRNSKGRISAWLYADGHSDDSPHLQRALDQGGGLWLPPAALIVKRSLVLHNVQIVGAPTALRWEGPME